MRNDTGTLLLLGIAGVMAISGAYAGDLGGKVVNDEGQPVAGARVVSYAISFPPPSAQLEGETATADDGSFTLTNLPDLGMGGMMGLSARSVVVLAEGYAVGGATLDSEDLKGELELVVRLGPSSTTSGKVTGPKGEPIEGATVRVWGVQWPSTEGPGMSFLWLWDTIGSPSTATDAAGTFTLESLPAQGMLALYVEHPDYAGRMVGGAAGTTEALAITLQQAGSLEGRVILRETQRGVARAKVVGMGSGRETSWAWARTDEAGCYSLSGLGTGEYAVMVFPLEEGAEWISTGGKMATIVAGQVTEGFDLEVIKGELVKGRVVDEESGQPVAGVSVYWSRVGDTTPFTTQEGRTGEDGTFELRVAPGTVNLRIARVPRGYLQPRMQEPTTVQVEEGKGAEGIELKIGRAVTITGRVVGPSGQAVPQAQIRTNDESISATTDEKGRFSLEGVAPGRSLQVWASAPEQNRAGEATVEAEKGAVKPLILKLGPAAQVEVPVVDTEGNPLAEPRVSATMVVSTGDVRSHLYVGAAVPKGEPGVYSVAGLVGGHEYLVKAAAEGYGSAQTESFTLKAGESRKLPPLVLRKADAVLTGRVMALSGKPVAGAVVRAGGNPATTDAQGNYRIENLTHGRGLYVGVSHPDYESDYRPNINPDDGPVNFLLMPQPKPPEVRAKPGQPAPELACAYWINSDRLNWRKLRGKVVLLAFSTARAGPCEELLPTLRALYQRYAAQGFTVLQVQDRSCSLGELRDWVRERELPYPVAMVQYGLNDGWAGEMFQSYGVQAVPALFLIDRAGVLHSVDSMARLSERIEGLLAPH